MHNLAAPANAVGQILPSAEWLTVALPRPADACYELFCDVEKIPEWLGVVSSAVVRRRDRLNRPREVAFLARLRRASIGYTLHYSYRSGERWVGWRTSEDASITVAGFGAFSPLGEKACLMTYALSINMGGLPGWSDPGFEGHAPSGAMSDFRDFVMRQF